MTQPLCNRNIINLHHQTQKSYQWNIFTHGVIDWIWLTSVRVILWLGTRVQLGRYPRGVVVPAPHGGVPVNEFQKKISSLPDWGPQQARVYHVQACNLSCQFIREGLHKEEKQMVSECAGLVQRMRSLIEFVPSGT